MNIEAALTHLRQEPNIARVIQEVEMSHFSPSRKVYFDLLESIVSQQLSVKAANTIFNRFLLLFPDRYPHPEHLLAIDVVQLREAGLSNQKAAYLKNVAQFALDNDLEAFEWDNMDDEAVIQLLTQIKGVGKWTVQMLLMFTLGRPDVLPVDDLGIQQGIAKLFGLQETGKDLKNKMIECAEPWKPWRTIACRYVWRWKDTR